LIHILRKERPDIKAILMSGYPNHAAGRDSDLEPDVVFINKPFPPIALTDTIRKVLDDVPMG
jgi:two-component system cell cycle sensor histidine kinase/response regulator CckA